MIVTLESPELMQFFRFMSSACAKFEKVPQIAVLVFADCARTCEQRGLIKVISGSVNDPINAHMQEVEVEMHHDKADEVTGSED